MNRAGALPALLAVLDLLGCQPQVIDALRPPGDADGSGLEAAVVDAAPEGAPDGGALAYYSFDEGTGSVVHDHSGNRHDGTLLGGTWTDAGRFGGAIRFAAGSDGGADEGIVVDPFMQPVKDWSVSFWLFVQSSELTGIATVLSTEVVMAGGWEVNVRPYSATFGSVEFAFWVAGDRYSIASCDCVTLGSWTHIVAVVDGSALTIQLYQDDVVAASQPDLGEFLVGNPYLLMGRWGGAGRPLVGVLDEVAIFDRTLSTGEVAELYAGVIP